MARAYGGHVAVDMRRTLRLGAVVVALLACDHDATRDGGRREEDAGGRLRDAGVDGGSDAGADAGRDAGAIDGGSPDTGPPDGGPPDAGRAECRAADVQVADACPAFTACGGALAEGERCYEDLCIERAELLAPMLPYCAAIVIEAATGTITGRTSLRDGEVGRTSTTELHVRIGFPSRCVVNGCDEVETLTRSQLTRFAVSCAMTDACRCDLAFAEIVERTTSYTADPSAGALTIGEGDEAEEHEYCVTDDFAVHLRTPVELGVHRVGAPL